jgi:ribosomal protein L2
MRRHKAGQFKNRGIKPLVRGTVKNANDHPNGGRNRSLLCSKTPWGYTTKKSRFPASKTKMKTLAKRLVAAAIEGKLQ